MPTKRLPLSPSLSFSMVLPKVSCARFIKGKLFLRDYQDSAGLMLEASSGLAWYQYWGSWTEKRKGQLPPSGVLATPSYSVSTQKLWLGHVQGIEGSFYAIAPFEVSMGNIRRGDFGVHWDGGTRGSAGCIVISDQKHWDYWRERMNYWQGEGFQAVALTVLYTCE